jgi:lipopolysaccharide export system protein LptA
MTLSKAVVTIVRRRQKQPPASALERPGGPAASRMIVSADSMRVFFDAKGRARQLTADSGVAFRVGHRRGAARRIVIKLPEQRVLLTGNARLRDSRSGVELSGRQIEIFARSGRVEISGATVRIPDLGRVLTPGARRLAK